MKMDVCIIIINSSTNNTSQLPVVSTFLEDKLIFFRVQKGIILLHGRDDMNDMM
jgi:hypothetical protein